MAAADAILLGSPTYFGDVLSEMKAFIDRSSMVNKANGDMACPCRLGSGGRDNDRNIICPCIYREPDVKEFVSCYCTLYVSADWFTGKIERQEVPERRPPKFYEAE